MNTAITGLYNSLGIPIDKRNKYCLKILLVLNSDEVAQANFVNIECRDTVVYDEDVQ